MKNKLISILLHPLFIALAISSAIIYFLPDYFTKYKVELTDQYYFSREGKIYYQDLNNDNQSEKIVSYDNSLGNACFEIHKPNNELIDQWNFSGKNLYHQLWFFDIDNNGFKEIYSITQKRDSVFLNIEEAFVKNGIHKMNILIDTLKEYNNKFKIFRNMYGVADVNSNGEKELFFNLNRGYSGNPRSIYKYNLTEDKIYKSPHLTNPVSIAQIIDLDHDGKKEILLRNHTAGNTIDTVYTQRSDYSIWFSILDADLKFKFNPIEFKIYPSSITSHATKDKNGNYQILSLLNSRNEEESPDKFLIFSNAGKLQQEKALSSGDYHFLLDSNEDVILLSNWEKGKFLKLDTRLNVLETYDFKPGSIITPIDLNADDHPEWLAKTVDSKILTIYDENFQDPVSFQLPNNSDDDIRYGLKQIGEKENEIYFQKGKYHYIYHYGENPLYNLRYLIYLGIFLLVFSFLWLARKGQKIQMEKKRAIEDQISRLQIKTLKNQVDPHFVFNAVNTISEMTLTEDKMEVDRFISKFSKLMRETLQKSDKIITTLQEELDYVENYIQLQQIRFNNGFKYKIKKDLNVNYQTRVPNHVIYTYVENAIKHGLSGKTDGKLEISVYSKKEHIEIVISNNGGGIETSTAPKKNSTGNGMKIMEKMYALYEKLYKKKIVHQMTEIKDDQGKTTGVRVRVIISK